MVTIDFSKIEKKKPKWCKNLDRASISKEVFLDFTNFYRVFIKNFSRIITPLNSILQTTNEVTEVGSPSIKANNNKEKK